MLPVGAILQQAVTLPSFHVDPLNLLVVIGTALGLYYKFVKKETIALKNLEDLTKSHEQHITDCNELRKQNNVIIRELQENIVRLTTMQQAHLDRLKLLEDRDRRIR